MVQIPANSVSFDDIAQWEQAKKELGLLKAKEALLRMKVFRGCFPEPREGTNKFPLGNDYVLKATHVISREIDIAALTSSIVMLQENKIPTDSLISYTPKLVMSEYRTLTDEERNLFDRVLVVKEGSPQISIELPAKAAKKAEAVALMSAVGAPETDHQG